MVGAAARRRDGRRWSLAPKLQHRAVRTTAGSRTQLDIDERYAIRLETPGSYDYFCSLHPKMTGKIVVQQRPVRD